MHTLLEIDCLRNDYLMHFECCPTPLKSSKKDFLQELYSSYNSFKEGHSGICSLQTPTINLLFCQQPMKHNTRSSSSGKGFKQVVSLLSFPVAICKQAIQVNILCLSLQWACGLEFVIKIGFRIIIKFHQFTNMLNTYLCL